MGIDRNESMRQLIDLAVAYGKKRQSPQTGYLHYCHGVHDEESHLTIPLVENFLYALALLRTRLIENVNEAKSLLERLLHFRTESGNFPIYLHEYPQCNDRFTGIQVAGVIYWILKLYPQGLGELKKRLEEVLLKALKDALKSHQEKPASYQTALKIAATAKSAGELLEEPVLVKEGETLLKLLHANQDQAALLSPKTVAQILNALFMAYPRLSDSPWIDLWTTIGATWHRKTCTYVGPALKEWQQGEEPQVTLYDMYLGYFAGVFSKRALKPNSAHLEAMLIQSNDDPLLEPTYPIQLKGELNGNQWEMFHQQGYAYSVFENGKMELNPAVEKGFHPLRLVWGDKDRVHTFVCQNGNSSVVKFDAGAHAISLTFALGEELEIEDKEKSRDVIFYLDAHQELNFLVAGHPSSTFRVDEEISIKDNYCRLLLNFEMPEGEGRFFGHRMLGNRPAQQDVKRKNHYSAFDWQLFLRTVGRSPKGIIKVSLKISENE